MRERDKDCRSGISRGSEQELGLKGTSDLEGNSAAMSEVILALKGRVAWECGKYGVWRQ